MFLILETKMMIYIFVSHTQINVNTNSHFFIILKLLWISMSNINLGPIWSTSNMFKLLVQYIFSWCYSKRSRKQHRPMHQEEWQTSQAMARRPCRHHPTAWRWPSWASRARVRPSGYTSATYPFASETLIFVPCLGWVSEILWAVWLPIGLKE